jgi:nucleoside-diphosphate kinase
MERTFGIIKPDGTSRNLIGKITAQLENSNLKIAAMKMKSLSQNEAEGFYAEHKARPFFPELVEFMCSKPVVLLVLEGQNAVKINRDIMGATNPAEAAEGTIRKLYSQSIGENTIHGSDSLDSAKREIAYFFSETEIN